MDKLALALAMVAPGFAVVVLAFGLIVRSRKTGSFWGGRLLYLGIAVMTLVPGVTIAGLALLGRMQMPALFGALVALLFGIRVLYRLRLHWADPLRGRPPRVDRPSPN